MKFTFRKINNWIHLWLGLVSGLIVFIVCVTACLWVFQEEVTDLVKPELRIAPKDQAILLPSELLTIAEKKYPDLKVSYAIYRRERTIHLNLGERRGKGVGLEINPYTGAIISENKSGEGLAGFFRWAIVGHRFLWLPVEIGRPIVNYGTLIFVILLITGLIWWYPRKWNRATRDKSFRIKWGASFKRINLDLHNVLGFYSLLFVLAIALTGMVYGLEWYSKGLYWVTTGGQHLPAREKAQSDTSQIGQLYSRAQAMDKAWGTVIRKHPEAMGFYYSFPDTRRPASTINMTVYPSKGQFYNSQSYTFDQHTLQELPKNEIYGTPFGQAEFGAKLRRMNYDIHIGSILGFPGKVLAFLVTLIGASLPVTGFIIWWNRKGFGKRKGRRPALKQREREVNDKARPIRIRPEFNRSFKSGINQQ
ncbi:PepSY-associated TM helix domain-containing protein [Dyadobacter tibetensis]|uniref:PepSY-associated TM helix domain-containing protein n=1 Tax=Dyadobacter tibetensis TaxID=1211851 RepID=UPI000472F6FE|nr:PepSY-associated TM helix domain-containing protein [Dyadobacter tibetensis]